MSDELTRAKLGHVGELLIRAGRLVDEAGIRRARARWTFTDLRRAHTQLLPYLDFDGIHQTELARRAGVTKQAVGPVLRDLEAAGLVERVPDPADGRARLVRYTPAGHEALLAGLEELRAVEAVIAERIGDEGMSALRRWLPAAIDALDDA